MPEQETTLDTAQMRRVANVPRTTDLARRFYCGTYLSRNSAIKAHTSELGAGWKACYRKGDRAVRVRVTEIANA